ncbi:MAG: hypothetical protein ACHQNT_05790 [Bacteroidia bacterium]
MKHFYTVLLLLGFEFSNAQEITMEQTLDYINKKIAPSCSLDVLKGNILSVYKENGETIREDEVRVADLDMTSMKYDGTLKIFSINCKGAPSKKCVSRELPTYGSTGVYRPYARISWEVNLSEKGVQGMKNAFMHMSRMVMEPKYKSNEPFE